MRVLLMMVFLTVAGPITALATAPDDGSDMRLVVVPPWDDANAVVVAAGGHVIGPERAPFAVLAQVDHPRAFAVAARRAGALAVLNGATIAAFCGVDV
ncbi:hypothetical protein [uncultured Tateyamaria sp.]|uniref:hypothetical protein n=1 Tax=Tateyamaria sp. 1078 TaxID=3417464 RepID=UPI00261AA1A6|nr:hypothetical protein [uncultured Tateyamaria sp.]